MLPVMKLEERYKTDISFNSMTNAIYEQLQKGSLTPSEVREAAHLACVKFELNHQSVIQNVVAPKAEAKPIVEAVANQTEG